MEEGGMIRGQETGIDQKEDVISDVIIRKNKAKIIGINRAVTHHNDANQTWQSIITSGQPNVLNHKPKIKGMNIQRVDKNAGQGNGSHQSCLWKQKNTVNFPHFPPCATESTSALQLNDFNVGIKKVNTNVEQNEEDVQLANLHRGKVLVKKQVQPLSPAPTRNRNAAELEQKKKKETMQLTQNFNMNDDSHGSVIFNENLVVEDLHRIIQVSASTQSKNECDRQPAKNSGFQAIDNGTFGQVWSLASKNGLNLAVKEMSKKQGTQVDFQEILAPLGLREQGIVKILGVMSYCSKFWIIMENAGKSLKKKFSDQDKDFLTYKENNFEDLVLQAFEICRYLERHNLCHRDMKPENFCIHKLSDGGYRLVLVDFGSCQPSHAKPKYAAHTHEYLPPKVVQVIYQIRVLKNDVVIGKIFSDEHADAWGTALTLLWVFLNGIHVFQRVNQYSRDHDTMRREREEMMKVIINLQENWCDPVLKSLPEKLYKVFASVLTIDSTKRRGATDVCNFLSDGKRKRQLEESDIKLVIVPPQLKRHKVMPDVDFNRMGFTYKNVEKPQSSFTQAPTCGNIPDMYALASGNGGNDNDKNFTFRKQGHDPQQKVMMDCGDDKNDRYGFGFGFTPPKLGNDKPILQTRPVFGNTASTSTSEHSGGKFDGFLKVKINFPSTSTAAGTFESYDNNTIINLGGAPSSHNNVQPMESPTISLNPTQPQYQTFNTNVLPNFQMIDPQFSKTDNSSANKSGKIKGNK